MAKSQNGWTVLDTAPDKVVMIPGVLSLRVLPGPVAVIFTDLARQFHKYVEPVDLHVDERPGYDDWGWAKRPVRGSTTVYSNHSSGTAIDLNATRHPRGVKNTFKPAQVDKIREILSSYKGVVRWGGDYKTTIDEMHFEINDDFDRVRDIATDIIVRNAPKPVPTPLKRTDMLGTDLIPVTGSARDFLQARGAVLTDQNNKPVAKGKDGYVTYNWLLIWGYISQVQATEAETKALVTLGEIEENTDDVPEIRPN